MPMTHIPEIRAENRYWFSEVSDMQFGTTVFLGNKYDNALLLCQFLAMVFGTKKSAPTSGMRVIGITVHYHAHVLHILNMNS